MDHPSMTPGPEINGEPSIISLLTPEQLKSYPHLPSLRLFANTAFESNHGGHATDHLFPAGAIRLRSDLQICDELGPDSFTYIVSSSDGGGTLRLYATASGRLTQPEGHKTAAVDSLPVLRRTEAPLDLERYDAWELRLLAVDPALHKQGLGSLVTRLVEAEAAKRHAERTLQRSKMQSIAANGTATESRKAQAAASNNQSVDKKLILTLNAVREVNEAYYLRRGFVTMEVKTLPKGFGGSSRDWDLVFMQKDVTI